MSGILLSIYGSKPDNLGLHRLKTSSMIYIYQSTMSVRLGYLPLSTHTFDVLCNTADNNLFACVLNNPFHVLHKLFTQYSMRPQSPNRDLSLCLTICLRNDMTPEVDRATLLLRT